MKRKLLSVILSFAFVVGLLPIIVLANNTNSTTDEGWLFPVEQRRTTHQANRISSPMQEKRSTDSKPHNGIDIANSNYVVATKSGKIVHVRTNWKNSSDGYGIYVVIEHYDKNENPNFYSLYAHLAENSLTENIKTGEWINQGDRIGTAGNTGRSDNGAHVHFEVSTKVKSGGKAYLDPNHQVNVNPNEDSLKSLVVSNVESNKIGTVTNNFKSAVENISWKGERMQYIFEILKVDDTEIPEIDIEITPINATYYAVKDDVPVRATPYSSDTILSYLSKDTPIDITGSGYNSVGNLWYKIKTIDEQIRWIFSENLTDKYPTKTVPKTKNIIRAVNLKGYAVKDGVPVRATPYASDEILETIDKNTEVHIIGSGTNSSGNLWYKINFNGKTRWIFSDNISLRKLS